MKYTFDISKTAEDIDGSTTTTTYTAKITLACNTSGTLLVSSKPREVEFSIKTSGGSSTIACETNITDILANLIDNTRVTTDERDDGIVFNNAFNLFVHQ